MSNKTPPAPTYGGVTGNALNTQYSQAPQMYDEQAQYAPMYASLGASNVNTALNGPTGILTSIGQANTAQRTGDINDVTTLGGNAASAVLGTNPSQAKLLATLNNQAGSELSAGSNLTPEEQYAMQQASRAGYAARGMTGSNASIADEAMRQWQLGQQLLQQRQAFGSNVAGMNQNYVTSPAMMLAMGQSPGVGMAMGSNSTAGPTLWNPNASNQLAAGEYQQQLAYAAGTPTGWQNTLAGVNAAANLTSSITSAL